MNPSIRSQTDSHLFQRSVSRKMAVKQLMEMQRREPNKEESVKRFILKGIGNLEESRNIQTLNLGNCKIYSLQFLHRSEWPSMRNLNLSKYVRSRLQFFNYPARDEEEMLYLRGNFLTNMDELSQASLPKLHMVFLSENKLSQLCIVKLCYACPKKPKFHVHGNKIQRSCIFCKPQIKR